MAYDNVILFGAGAAWDAGIPLLGNFVDTMWSYAIRGTSPQGSLNGDDKSLLERANAIRIELERYNSRANFNLRNLEDVLSLLYFESLGGGEGLERYQVWVKAIARTIELSSSYPEVLNENPVGEHKNTPYHWFWHCFLGPEPRKRMPALLTFNYDLLFERTLWQYFHFLPNLEVKPDVASCKVNYFLQPYDFVLRAEDTQYQLPRQDAPKMTAVWRGLRANATFGGNAAVEIPFLKLHGSLNWCSHTVASANREQKELTPGNRPTASVEAPLILPPIFNKMNSADVGSVWQKALEILRQAKHIIVVGYSLPKTDVYMQYFLKAAAGANSSLQKIFVFDPVLFRGDRATQEMQARYSECFAPQFIDSIIFKPKKSAGVDETNPARGLGTFFHFVQALKYDWRELLF